MLEKSYPMRYHEERPSSLDEIDSAENQRVPNSDARTSNTNEEPRVVVVISKGLAEARAKRNAALGLPPSPFLISEDDPRLQRPELAPNEPTENASACPTPFMMYSNWPPDHHSRHCTVCRHPWRGAIEEEFLHWASPDAISHHYNVGWRSVYRHAHALGLFDKRGRNLRSALGHIIEHANHVAPTAENVIRAIRSYACVNKSGKWIEPTRHVEFSSTNPRPRSTRKRRKSEALPEPGTIDVGAGRDAGAPSPLSSLTSADPPSES